MIHQIALLSALGWFLAPVPSPTIPEDSRIGWYGTLKEGLAEAKRSNRPVLLVSAAPHCQGVPGIW